MYTYKCTQIIGDGSWGDKCHHVMDEQAWREEWNEELNDAVSWMMSHWWVLLHESFERGWKNFGRKGIDTWYKNSNLIKLVRKSLKIRKETLIKKNPFSREWDEEMNEKDESENKNFFTLGWLLNVWTEKFHLSHLYNNSFSPQFFSLISLSSPFRSLLLFFSWWKEGK